MARSKSFDPAEKLETAMHLFWRKGFEATSLDHLEMELELKRFSIYNAFGDKLTLYKDSLELYLERYFYPSLRALDQSSSLAGISEFFASQVEFLTKFPQGYGCFVYKAAMEMEKDYVQIGELTRRAQTDLLDAFQQALEQDRSKGLLACTVEPEVSSRWLLTLYRGLISSDSVEREKEWMKGFNQQLQQVLHHWQVDSASACA